MKPREAMQLTLREIVLFAKGVNATRRENWRQQIAHAHLIASLGRVPRNKRLPPLATLLPRENTITRPVAERKREFWDVVKQMSRPGEIQVGKKAKKK